MAETLVQMKPFNNIDDLMTKCSSSWYQLDREAQIAVFMKHPKIGDIETMKKTRYSNREQRGIYAASDEMLSRFIELNHLYQQKFGYIYMVFAAGKSAQQMFDILQQRLGNSADDEFSIASTEKNHINLARLRQFVLTQQPLKESNSIQSHTITITKETA